MSDNKRPSVGLTTRKPVGLRRRDSTPGRKGYRRRWVNDVEDRIQMFTDGGYAPVKDSSGNIKSRRSGGGQKAILMEIDENFYEQDQRTKYKMWNEQTNELLQSRADKPGFYQPRKMQIGKVNIHD